MDRVCCIMDMDGFHLSLDGGFNKNKFFVRELGYVRMSKEYTFVPRSHRFDLRGEFDMDNLDPKLEQKLHYQIKLTGLSIFPSEDEPVLTYNDLPNLIMSIYTRCRTKDMNVIAYKGGIIEKTLLSDLKIRSLNLESYGCPKYEELINSKVSLSAPNCGFHRETTVSLPHCPLAEVTAFRDWFQLRCRYRNTQDEGSDSETSDEESDSEDEYC